MRESQDAHGNTSARIIDHETCIAYYRRALPPRQAARVEEWLQSHPHAAEQAEIDASLEHAIAQPLAQVLHEPLPTRLQFGSRRAMLAWPRRAALLATIVLAASGGWWLGGVPTNGDRQASFAERVATAARQPLPAVSTLQMLGEGRIAVQAPDLSARGYQLVQQRRLRQHEPALAEFIYRNGDGEQLRVYAEAGAEPHVAPRISNQDGVAVAQWRAHGTDYALVGELPAPSLRELAQVASSEVTDDATNMADTALSYDDYTEVPGASTAVQSQEPAGETVMPANAGNDMLVQPGQM